MGQGRGRGHWRGRWGLDCTGPPRINYHCNYFFNILNLISFHCTFDGFLQFKIVAYYFNYY